MQLGQSINRALIRMGLGVTGLCHGCPRDLNADIKRKMLGKESRFSLRRSEGLLHAVDQFADITGPGIAGQRFKKFRRKPFRRQTVTQTEAISIKARQLLNILVSLAQCRQLNTIGLQPEEEIGTKLATLHHFFQVAIGRCHQTKIAGQLPRSPEWAKTPLLKDPQKSLLQAQGQFADFIEKEGAAVRLQHQSVTGFVGAGKGALFMAEEETLYQCFRQGRTIDDDEISAATLAVFVNSAGKELLAGAGFAEETNIDFTSGRLGNLIETGLKFWAVTDDLLALQGSDTLPPGNGELFLTVLQGPLQRQDDILHR